MKKDADYFDGLEAELIFIAKKLKDATRLEGILNEAGVDYGVEADEYYGGTIFRRVRVGAFFYVRPETRERAVALMEDNGFVPSPPDPESGPGALPAAQS